ncbi:MAG: VWA domain-containing protein [Roseobacter sp.]
MAEVFGLFHFLRPLWFLALLPVLALWWQMRPREDTSDRAPKGIAPHLAQALRVGASERSRVQPVDGLALAVTLLVLAAAGPSWTRVDNPLLAQTAPLVVALKVTPSMENADIQPSRLARAGFKILDLVERRGGAQTALFAYAGSAHRVTPLTEDPSILRAYLSGLEPDVMPEAGDRADEALAQAQAELARSETPGAILMVLDDMAPGSIAAFEQEPQARAPVIFLVAAGASVALPQLDGVENSSVIRLSPDDSDLDQIERRVLSAYRDALLDDPQQDWEDRGWLLAWPALLLLLPWFRRGWTLRAAVLAGLFLPMGTPAQADGWRGWFLTPDQQGQMAMNRNQFAAAADLFQDPDQKAHALLRAGRYEEAAEAFSFIETTEAAMGEGVALLRNRKYGDGVRTFEKALERDPGNAQAEENLTVAKAIRDFVESTQAASDTGEDTGIGADDMVFDNESGQGQDTEINPEEEAGPATGLSTEDWMRAVDTQVGDFLASRFRLETTAGAE